MKKGEGGINTDAPGFCFSVILSVVHSMAQKFSI